MGLPVGMEKVYLAIGCPQCRKTGYSGRIGLHELLMNNLEIRELILECQSSLRIEEAAAKTGMLTLRQDGYHKVYEGLTSLEEVWYSTSVMT